MDIENLLQIYDEAIEDENTRKDEIADFQQDVQSHLEAVKEAAFHSDKAINDLTAAKERLVSEKENLEQQDKAAQKSAEDYFDGVSAVSAALSTGGSLAGQLTAKKNAILGILSITDADLNTLLNEIDTHDQETQKIEDDAVAALQTAQSEYDSASKKMDEKGDALKSAFEALSNLSQNAMVEKGGADSDLKAVANSIAADEGIEAVVTYYDFKSRMDSLTGDVDLLKPSFDADNTNKNVLTAGLKAAWTSAKDAYVSALKSKHEKYMTLISITSELDQAKADVEKRKADRTEETAKLIEEKYSQIAPVITSP